MQSGIEQIQDLGAVVLAVSTDTPEENQGLVASAQLEFSLLSDRDLKAIDAFGLRHPGASMEGGDIARPAVFVIDRDGTIVWRSLTDNWRVRVRTETILKELKKLP